MSDFDGTARLCDDKGLMHGSDIPCTGSAHAGGKHIRCTNPIHEPKSLYEAATVDPSDPLALQEVSRG